MKKGLYISILSIFWLFAGMQHAWSQEIENINNSKGLDSIRNKFDGEQDTIVPTAKFIRYASLAMLQDSVRTLPLDTSLKNVQYPSVLFQPMQPTIGIGNLGVAAKNLLFEPSEIIGFDIGMHSLDKYRYTHEDVLYYRARSPFTSLYYSNARITEQILKVIHSQNITKNWSIGANFNRIGAEGFYGRQRGDILNASLQTWYKSQNKRYNLLSSAIFNTLKAYENGGLLNNNPFAKMVINEPTALPVNLTKAGNIWRDNGLMVKQSYFIGRVDSAIRDSVMTVYPTNKITHTFTFANRSFLFYKNAIDAPYVAIPKGILDTAITNDTTNFKQLKNEFTYTFFVRGKNTESIKNEIKINAGIIHDLYILKSFSKNQNGTFYPYQLTFQNIILKGDASYRFSNKANVNFLVNQYVQGRQAGDFYYQGSSFFNLGRIAGKIALQASIQNKSVGWIYNYTQGNHFRWLNNFDRTKTSKATFAYDNEMLKFSGNVNYYLISNYVYLQRDGNSSNVIPKQHSPLINVLQISTYKTANYKKFQWQGYIVYQKTDRPDVIRTPEFYTFQSISYKQTIFKYFKFETGVDVLYNTAFKNYAYSPALGQFYNSDREPNLASYPVMNVWIKANLKRANFFARYDYVNQGVFSPGYYTVEQYPMGSRILKLGVMWNFYD